MIKIAADQCVTKTYINFWNSLIETSYGDPLCQNFSITHFSDIPTPEGGNIKIFRDDQAIEHISNLKYSGLITLDLSAYDADFSEERARENKVKIIFFEDVWNFSNNKFYKGESVLYKKCKFISYLTSIFHYMVRILSSDDDEKLVYYLADRPLSFPSDNKLYNIFHQHDSPKKFS